MKNLRKITLLILISAAIYSCNKKDSTKEVSEKDTKNSNSTNIRKEINFEGNYVSDDYSKRNEDFDWVAVSVTKLSDSTYHVSVRSRADKKKPSCTFDANAVKSGNNFLKASVEGTNVLFTFNDSTVNIATENEDDMDKLKFYCSGGATFAGSYVKINEPLDKTQIDPRIFQKFLTLQNISFEVSTTGEGSIQKLSIQPSGLETDNSLITMDIDGSVTNAEIEDLNSDGFPELLIYTTSAGSGSYGKVLGYSVNDGKSVSSIYFPPVSENQVAKEGYMGHDEFAVVENYLVQRFPVYKTGDVNSKPTGNIRQITYKLVDGEASRKFVVDKIVEITPE